MVAGGKFNLTLRSGTAAGGQFLVTSGNRSDGPWTYTTEAGKSIADTWNTAYSGGLYDLTVHGPNGFLRTFHGKPVAGLEVAAKHNARSGDLDLTITNNGDATTTVTITNTYGGKPRTLKLRAGSHARYTVDLAQSRRWYDVVVTADAFLRRLAGHVETGDPGLSDPAIITS